MAPHERRRLEDGADAGNEQPDDENDADDDAEQNATHSLSTDAVISRSISKPGAEARRASNRSEGDDLEGANLESTSRAGPTLEGPEWRLSDHLGPDGALVPVAEDVTATALFAAGRVSGTTGCNRFSGPYRADGSSLSLGSLAMTRMACLPPRDAVEGAMTAALETTAGYTLSGDGLELTDAGGTTVLRFRAGTGPDLVGTTWVATGINNGRGGVVSSVALEAARVTATFADDGRVTGFGGCNRLGGSYTLDGGSMRIGPLTATRNGCIEPEGVGELEGWYFAALERVATWSIREGRLQLRDGEGALQVDYRVAGE